MSPLLMSNVRIESVGSTPMSATMTLQGSAGAHLVFGGVPYDDGTAAAVAREGFCVGNDNTCRARKTKGTDLCVGHGRRVAE